MTRTYLPGELRIAVLGDLLRVPGTKAPDMARRLDVRDPQTLRVTLGRMADAGWVRRLSAGGWMLTQQGRDYVGKVRGWLDTEQAG